MEWQQAGREKQAFSRGKGPVRKTEMVTWYSLIDGIMQVREILAEKYKVDIEKYRFNIREFVDELVQAAWACWAPVGRSWKRGEALVKDWVLVKHVCAPL
jgi:hypothetical protein